MKVNRRKLWTILVAIATAVVLVILGLIGAGVLVLPASGPPAPVTVTEVCVTVLQGQTSNGTGWFGSGSYCLNGVANHYPYQQAAGTPVKIFLPILNYDSVTRTLWSVEVAAPFSFQFSLPPLPYNVTSYTVNPEGIDGGLAVQVLLPSTPGAVLVMHVTLDALGAGG
ncbi:MAG: hypothetical protein WBF81_09435 [Thermoplasmata archaeon]